MSSFSTRLTSSTPPVSSTSTRFPTPPAPALPPPAGGRMCPAVSPTRESDSLPTSPVSSAASFVNLSLAAKSPWLSSAGRIRMKTFCSAEAAASAIFRSISTPPIFGPATSPPFGSNRSPKTAHLASLSAGGWDDYGVLTPLRQGRAGRLDAFNFALDPRSSVPPCHALIQLPALPDEPRWVIDFDRGCLTSGSQGRTPLRIFLQFQNRLSKCSYVVPRNDCQPRTAPQLTHRRRLGCNDGQPGPGASRQRQHCRVG